MGTAFDKVMENRKSLETAIFDSIRENQSLFRYSSLAGSLMLPVNSAKKHTYQGVNAVRLMQKAMERGINDNRWLTFNQAKDLGCHVKKGSTGVLCEQWEFDDKTTGATGMPKVSYYYVFNAADIEGMEPLVPEVPEVSEEYRNLIEQGIKEHTADMDDGLLINLINVFVKAKYGLLTADYKDSEMHELSFIMKNAARDTNYVPATIKKAQEESNIISLELDEALLSMVQNNEPLPIAEDIPEEPYEEDAGPDDDIEEEFSERYEVVVTSDAFETPYAVWDNIADDYYVEDSWIPTFETEEEAAELCARLNGALETDKEVTEDAEPNEDYKDSDWFELEVTEETIEFEEDQEEELKEEDEHIKEEMRELLNNARERGQTLFDVLKQDGRALILVENQTPEMCMAAVKQSYKALRYVKQQTPEICMAAVKQNGMALMFVKQQTPELCLAAVQQDGNAFLESKWQSEKLCLAAVQQNGAMLEFVEKPTLAICLAAVKQNGDALIHVPWEYQNLEVWLAAVKQNGLALDHVDWIAFDELPGDVQDEYLEKLYLEAVKQNGLALQYIDEPWQTPELVNAALAQNPKAKKYVKNKNMTQSPVGEQISLFSSDAAKENDNYMFSFTEENEQSAEIEMEPEEPAAEDKKKTTKSKPKIEDFGKKIGGARKDMWASRGLNISDLGELNASEKEKYITKDNVWKKPDYEKLIADGLPVKVVWFMKSVRDKVPTRPNYTSYHSEEEKNAIREEYISFVGAIRDEVMACIAREDCVGLCQRFFHDQGYVERTGSYSLSPTEKCLHHLDNKLYKVFRDANYDWGYTYDKQIKKHQFGVDADKKLPKGYAIREYTTGTFSIIKGYTLVKDGFDSWEAAKKYAEEIAKPTSRKKAFTPPQLEHVRREGLVDIRNENNITGDDFLVDYGFYGGEFGNWMSETDRQASLNMGYEAFYDLAEALQISNSDVSFNGKLSIAFGARGHGKAAAHYEPLREVINLTKMTGAGSLAHEWGHALDDYFGKKLGYGKMLTETRAEEIKEVMDAMRYRPATEEEKAEKYDRFLADRSATASTRCVEVINRYKEAAEASKTIALSDEAQTRYVEAANKLDELLTVVAEKLVLKDYESCMDLVEQAEQLVRETNLCDGSLSKIINLKGDIIFISDWTKARDNYKVETDYYKGSKQMDDASAKCDKGYWASSCEMFARAFSCYVMDKLKPGRSDYLCGHSESAATIADGKVVRAYPVGEERTRINAALDNLIQQMKEREFLTERSGMVRNRKI